MAVFCLTTGIAPSEYRALTRRQRQSFLDQIEKATKKK